MMKQVVILLLAIIASASAVNNNVTLDSLVLPEVQYFAILSAQLYRDLV